MDNIDERDLVKSINALPTVNFHSKYDKKPIQLIKTAWHVDDVSLIKLFDITLAQVAFSKEKGVSFNPLGVLDGVAKRVSLSNNIQASPAALARLIKYTQKGMAVTSISLATIASRFEGAAAYVHDKATYEALKTARLAASSTSVDNSESY